MKCNRYIKRVLLLMVALILLAVMMPIGNLDMVAAQTEDTLAISVIINEDTTWTVANSPYIITESVLVAEGVTLTIELGVVVKFDSGKGLQVDGQLIAQGTEAEPILFTSNQTFPLPGNWVNILFSDTSVDASYDGDGNYLSGSIMQYCTVEYGGGSDMPALRIVSASPLIDHCNIRGNAESGIYVDEGSPRITNNTISNNSADRSGGGIYVDEGSPRITNNTISNNSADVGGGIYVSRGTATISNNTISNNSAEYSGGGIYARGSWWGDAVTITNNIITNNSARYGGGIYASGDTVSIANNTISNNSAEYSGGGIYAEEAVTITNNTISNNSADRSGGGIYAEGAVTITNNSIVGNYISEGDGKGGGIDISDGQPTINYNNIYSNTPYDIYNANEQGFPHVDATENWWGTTDEAQIQEKIYDWFDDASLGIIDYIPFLTGPVVGVLPGDFDGDGDIDFYDFYQFADAYGSETGDPNYNAIGDFDDDGDIDFYDFYDFADVYGYGT